MKKAKLHSQRNQIVVIVAFFVVVALGGWFVLISPQRSQATTLGARVTGVEQQIALRQAAIDSQRQTQQIRTADLFRLTKAMPDQTDMPDILLELSRIARDTGIEFQSITPNAPTPLSGFQVVPIDLIFQGNFYDLADFVYRLRNLVGVHDGRLTATGRLFSIDKIDFAEGQNKFPQILATLTVDAYVYGTPSLGTTGAPAGAAPTGTTTGTTGTTTPPATGGSTAAPTTTSPTGATN